MNTTPGNQVTAVLLHIDFLTSEVHVSLLPKLKVKKKKVSRNTDVGLVNEVKKKNR